MGYPARVSATPSEVPMRPAPIIEILGRFPFDLELDWRDVFDIGCGRFLDDGIGFEIEWVACADSSMASTPSQFRGFSSLLVYNADDAIRGSLPKEKLKAMRNLGLRPGIQALP